MASNRPSFNKRQKERARQEKRAEKAEKKAQRKLEKPAVPAERSGTPAIQYDEEGQPLALDFHDF